MFGFREMLRLISYVQLQRFNRHALIRLTRVFSLSVSGMHGTLPSAHRSKQCTLGAQSYKWYGMDAQDVLIVKIPIIRKLYWPLLRY